MIRLQVLHRLTLRSILLGCVTFSVSCTTTNISTQGTGPTAALESLAATTPQFVGSVPSAGEPDNQIEAAQNSAITFASAPITATSQDQAQPPDAAQIAVASAEGTAEQAEISPEAIAFADTPSTDSATVETAVAPPSEPVTETANIAGDTPAPMTPNARVAAASAPSQPTGIFALLRRNTKPAEKPAPAIVEDDEPAHGEEEADAPAEIAQVSEAAPKTERVAAAPKRQEMRSLPGVRSESLFGITASSARDAVEAPIQYASAAIGSAVRGATNGLLTQTEKVDVACFRPELIKTLNKIERHYGKKLVVTSGFRSPGSNRKAGGSKKSMHMYCAAADVQVPGVSKSALAKFVRSMPGRGGVGTYCHTDSVHVDIGSKRDWNWRCRRK